MRYFIRHDKDAEVDGSFSVQQLITEIDAGRIPPSALASSDIGDSAASLRRWRRCDWFPLAAIPDLRDVIPPTPEPAPKLHRVTVVTIACWLLVTLGCLHSAITRQSWFMGLLTVMACLGVVDSMIRFARERRLKSQGA